MSATRSPQQPQWQAARVPKLSYRKPLTQDELDKINSAPPREYVPQANPVARNVSVRDTVERPAPPSSNQVPSKKKGSILSGFFSKEPTISALAQVEADLTAKHGAATPQTVPHVSSRKMPEHVPKVNAKWDGVPELVKMRERDDKQRKRLSQQSSFASPGHYIYSPGSDDAVHELEAPPHHKQVRLRRDSDLASHSDSWQSHNGRYSEPRRHGSFSTATSSNASVEDKSHVAASSKPQPARSTSGNSLPEITSFFPHHQAGPAARVPLSSQSSSSARYQSTRSMSSRSDVASSRTHYSSSIQGIPEHSSSPAVTPREVSPVTPIYSTEKEVAPGIVATKLSSVGAKNNKRQVARVQHVQIDAFLAGEAKPVELDDDSDDSDDYDDDDDDDSDASNRTRLPLRQKQIQTQVQPQQKDRAKSNVVMRTQPLRQGPEIKSSKVARSDTAPWETQEPVFSKPAAPTIAKNRIPKVLAGFK